MNDQPLMKREKVEHVLRAAGRITGERRFVLIGSAAIVAWREVMPVEMIISRDVDMFAYDAADPERVSDQLDGAIGQASDFDRTFGYYCDGVGPETAIMPSDWQTRSIEFTTPNTEGVVAIVPDPDDIALSKVYAWRPKDIEWLNVAIRNMVVNPDQMRARLHLMPSRIIERSVLEQRIASLTKRG